MARKLLHSVHILLLLSVSFLVQGQWKNPLVYYQFNESAGSLIVDSGSYQNDAYANCDNCWESEGKFHGAFHFQGVHKIDLPAKEISLSNEKGTVAFWILLPQSSINSINCIWWAGEYGGDMFGPQNEMHINSEFVEANIWSGGEIAFVITDSVADDSYFIFSDPWKGPNPATPPSEHAIGLADGQWHHVACTWESGATVALYIDGQVIWDSTSYNPGLWDCKLMTIGAANERSNRRLNGYLDEFRIYNEALGAADIEEIYNYIPAGISNTIERGTKTGSITLNCFPNPVERNISLRNSSGIEVIEIYSLTGRKLVVQQISHVQETITINIETLSSGFYFLEAHGNNMPVAAAKFFKK